MTPRYPSPSALEVVSDNDGSVTRGWVANGVYYARFVDGLSAGLGLAHVARLREILSQVDSLMYFADARALAHYDLLARSAFVRLLLENRRRFPLVVILTWAGDVTAATEAFTAAVGSIVTLVREADEFEKLLSHVAPLANQMVAPNTWTKAAGRVLQAQDLGAIRRR
jgi:hypothetical protein